VDANWRLYKSILYSLLTEPNEYYTMYISIEAKSVIYIFMGGLYYAGAVYLGFYTALRVAKVFTLLE